MKIFLPQLPLACLTILLASCGGSSSTTPTTSSITATASQELEATISSLCKADCNPTVPDDNTIRQLEATIKTLQGSFNPYNEANLGETFISAENPSALLEATIAELQSSQ